MILKVRKGIRGAGQTSQTYFRRNAYNKLSNKDKSKIDAIFKEHIGDTVETIMELDFFK